jgi:ankyrin repeat protein
MQKLSDKNKLFEEIKKLPENERKSILRDLVENEQKKEIEYRKYLHSKENTMMIAAKIGDIEKIKEMLKKGVKPNFVGSDGETALMKAASGGHLEVVRYLLGHGAKADIDKRIVSGNSIVTVGICTIAQSGKLNHPHKDITALLELLEQHKGNW